MLLDSAAHGLGAVLTDAPTIGDLPGPLEDTLRALVVLGQDHLEVVNTSGVARQHPLLLPARGCQLVLVQALLGWVLLGTGGAAELEGEAAQVVGCHLYADVYSLPHGELPDECPSRILASRGLVLTHFSIPGVPTKAAPAPVHLPLDKEAAAEAFVVVVVGRGVKAVPPHRGTRGRLNKPSVARDQGDGREKADENSQHFSLFFSLLFSPV